MPAELPNALTEERRIDGFRNPQWVIRELAPAEFTAVQQALLVLEARMSPTQPETVITYIARLMRHDKRVRTPAEVDSVLSDFVNDLVGFSAEHVEEAVEHHRRTNQWFPAPAEIRVIALRLQAHDRVLRHRARVLLGLEEPSSWERPRAIQEPAPELNDQTFGARPHLDAEISKLPPALADSVRRFYSARQKRLGRPGPLFDRKSA